MIWVSFHKDIFESHKDAIISNWTIFQSYEIEQTYNIVRFISVDLIFWWGTNEMRENSNSGHIIKFGIQPNETEYAVQETTK